VSDFKKTSLRRAPQSTHAPPLILGYTRTGRDVLRPTSSTPTADACVDWTRGDHADAARILKEHGERELDRTIAAWCKRGARAHKARAGRGA
jgi:hypothetical protein